MTLLKRWWWSVMLVACMSRPLAAEPLSPKLAIAGVTTMAVGIGMMAPVWGRVPRVRPDALREYRAAIDRPWALRATHGASHHGGQVGDGRGNRADGAGLLARDAEGGDCADGGADCDRCEGAGAMVEVTLKRLVQFAPDTITQIVIPEPTLLFLKRF